jgi:ATP-binding cassette subfamily C exporter for protease/lipase
MNPSPNAAPSELRAALAELRPYFVRAAWFSLFSSVLILAPSAYMLEVYDRVVNSRSHMTLWMLTVLVLGAYALMEVLDWVRGEVMRAASVALDARLRDRVFHAIFDANLRRIPGGTQQPLNDFRQIREFLYSPAVLSAMEVPMSFVLLVLLFLISPLLGWCALAFSVLLVFVGWLNERSTKPRLMEANRVSIAAQQYAEGSLRNAQVIESMGMLRDIHARWLKRQREFLNLQAGASESAGGFQAVSKLFQTILSSLLLGLSAWLLLHNSLNGGAAMLIIGSVFGGRVLAPLVQAVAQWQQVVNVRDAWSRLSQLLATVPPRPKGMPLPAPRGVVQAEQIVAAAPGSNASILRGVSFQLAPGEVLAVVGPSASGKTTLARLLVGLWPAAVGKVRLDGVDIHTWNKAELGPYIGYLPQGVELFDGTLAENIARFGTVDPDKVEAAARAVGLHEFIMGLPQGYESQVGPEGARLSGGQRQRVGLARAIYGNPVFVVLDEPNSSLDEEGDAALAQAIGLLKSGGTTFVVMTHRTSVLAVSDRMMVLRDGQVQALGPRDEVLAALHKAAQQAGQPQAAAPAQAAPAQPAQPGQRALGAA